MFRRQDGDTLVEVAIALAILAVTLVTSFNIANMSYRVGVQARERIQAVNLAQGQADLLRLQRDQLIEQSLAPSSPCAATPGDFSACPIMTVHNFDCIGTAPTPATAGSGGCHLLIDPATNQVQVAGGSLATAPYNGITYHIYVTGSTNAAQTKGDFTVTVEWDSLVSGGDKNISQLHVVLVDNRGIVPRDCNVAGGSSC